MSIFPGFGKGPTQTFDNLKNQDITVQGQQLNDEERRLFAFREGDKVGNLGLVGDLNESGAKRVQDFRMGSSLVTPQKPDAPKQPPAAPRGRFPSGKRALKHNVRRG